LADVQPIVQQPSPSSHVVMRTCVQSTSHVDSMPARASMVHSFESSQDAGQLPSHVSRGSMTPFPHIAVHSESSFASQPTPQHPSPSSQPTGSCEHTTEHMPTEPVIPSAVHESPSLQLAGQLPSHASPLSTAPFPHSGSQSPSLFALHPPGQHESPLAQAIAGMCIQTTLQALTSPTSTSFVHGSTSAHTVGQSPSQVSPVSTIPFPHSFSQSLSTLLSQPPEQQPSSSVHVTGRN
jgi:hypothetical protein